MVNEITALDWDSLPARIQNLLGPRVQRLGYLGSFFKHTAHVPDVLAPYMEMTDALLEILPLNFSQVTTLTITALLEAPYERHQQEWASLRNGLTPDWVCAVQRCRPDKDVALSDDERIVQRFVIALIDRQGENMAVERNATLAVLGVEKTIAIMFLVGRFLTHILIVKALALPPPLPSIFDPTDN